MRAHQINKQILAEFFGGFHHPASSDWGRKQSLLLITVTLKCSESRGGWGNQGFVHLYFTLLLFNFSI